MASAITKDEPSLVYVASVLSAFYFVDGVMMLYITDESRVFTLSPGIFQANTAINTLTLIVNAIYVALEISIDKSLLLILLSVFTITYKTAKVITLHKLAVRFTSEAGLHGAAPKIGEQPTPDYVVMGGSNV